MAGESILVADDEGMHLKLAKRVLVAEGFEVHTVSNGQEALDELERVQGTDQHYHAVLTDLEMPIVDGMELTEKVTTGYGLPVVVRTSCASDPKIVVALKQAGAYKVIDKVPIKEVPESIRAALDHVNAHPKDTPLEGRTDVSYDASTPES